MPPAESLPEPAAGNATTAAELAYEFARPTYDILLKRLEAVENRIRGILTLAATLTLAAPVFLSGGLTRSAISICFFVIALVIFGAIAWFGLGPPSRGRIRVLSPMLLFERTLHLSDADFRLLVLKTAGQDFDSNMALINHHGRLADDMGLLLLAEAALLAVSAIMGAAAVYSPALSTAVCSLPLPPSLISTLITMLGTVGGGGVAVLGGCGEAGAASVGLSFLSAM